MNAFSVFVSPNEWTDRVKMAPENPRRDAPLDVIGTSLRRERARARRSLSEVAKLAGIAKSTLSQLESGTGNPSVETLWALSVALDVPISRLVEPAVPKVRVIRAGEGLTISSKRAQYTANLLAACPPNARRDLYLIDAEPGQARESLPHLAGTVEHVVLCVGRARVGLSDDPVELGPGDYTSYPGDLAHVFEALVPDTRAVLLSENA